MRSELVYEAGLKIENRFLLAATAMRAARRLHVNSTRTEDTVNRVLVEVGKRPVRIWETARGRTASRYRDIADYTRRLKAVSTISLHT